MAINGVPHAGSVEAIDFHDDFNELGEEIRLTWEDVKFRQRPIDNLFSFGALEAWEGDYWGSEN